MRDYGDYVPHLRVGEEDNKVLRFTYLSTHKLTINSNCKPKSTEPQLRSEKSETTEILFFICA